jgi:sirohydrochlorin cobaltochelatase
LFAHGSRDPRWREPFLRLESEIVADLGDGCARLAFMEFAPPTLLEVVGSFRRTGMTRLRLLPLFLAGGAHVARDIPEQVQQALERFPGMEIEVLPPVGEDRRLVSLLRGIAREAA